MLAKFWIAASDPHQLCKWTKKKKNIQSALEIIVTKNQHLRAENAARRPSYTYLHCTSQIIVSRLWAAEIIQSSIPSHLHIVQRSLNHTQQFSLQEKKVFAPRREKMKCYSVLSVLIRTLGCIFSTGAAVDVDGAITVSRGGRAPGACTRLIYVLLREV